MKKKRTQALSLALLFSMLMMLAVPYADVYAASNANGAPSTENAVEPEAVTDEMQAPPAKFPKPGKSKIELISKRTETTRTFLNPNGTFSTESYVEPIHWKDKNGKWKKINNNLKKTTKKDKVEYENEENAFQTTFPETVDGVINRIAVDEYEITVKPVDALKIKGNIKNNTITYKGIYPHTDIKYAATSTSVKEDVVLQNKQASNKLSLLLDTKELTPVLQKDNSIQFMNDKKEVVFTAPAPFASDDNGAMTTDIDVTLTKKADGWLLTETIDPAWIANNERAYPIVMDPTIIHQPGSSGTKDTFVYESDPTSSFYQAGYIRAGKNAYGKARAYVDFELPTVYSGANIIAATLRLNEYTAKNSTQVDVHRVTTPWESNTTTWNKQPTTSTEKTSQTRTTDGVQVFPVSDIVKDWYNGTQAHYGFMLKASGDETATRREFYSSETGDPTMAPKLQIDYTVDDIGSESFWAFDNGINLKNGNYVTGSTDAGVDGRGIPIAVERNYNSQNPTKGVLGYGWRLGSDMTLITKEADKNDVVILIDDDGTRHHFIKRDGTWNAPPGIDLELIYDTTAKTFKIKDKDQIEYQFNAAGKLTSVKDENSNTTTFTYDANGKLIKMTDTSGRFITLTYNTSGMLESLTGNEIKKTTYSYDSNDDLVKVEKISSDGVTVLTSVGYEYNSNHQLTATIDNAGHKSYVTYDSNKRANGFKQSVTEDGTTKDLNIKYDYFLTNGLTEVNKTNAKGIVTRFSLNNLGNLTKTQEDYNVSTGIADRTSESVWDQNNLVAEVKDPKGNSTVITYDSNNNVNGVKDPKGNKTLMKYDGKNNVTQVTGFAGETLKKYYDEKGNNNAQMDPSASFSLSDYDSYGNVKQTSSEISIANNLVPNSGFEKWGTTLPESWTIWGSGTGKIVGDVIHVNGKIGLGINSPNDETKLQTDFIPVSGQTVYNVSAYSRSNAVQNAKVTVRWCTSTSDCSTLPEETVFTTKGTQDWLQRSEQVEAPSTANYARISVSATKGVAWFDNLQFEEGSYINEFNMITNNGFEDDYDKDGHPDQWVKVGGVTDSDGIDKTQKKSGTSSVTIKGTTADKWYAQTSNIAGKQGDKFIVSGYTKSQGLNANGGPVDILFIYSYTDGTQGWYSTMISKANHNWTYSEASHTAKKDYKSYTVYVRANNQTGQIWFDDVMVRSTVANNAVVSKYNLALNPSFEAVDGNKTKDWTYVFQNTGTVYNVSRSEEEPVFVGDNSIKVSGTTGWAVIGNTHSEPIEDGKTYTFSVAAKANGVTSSNGALKFDIYDGNNTLIGQISSVDKNANQKITGTTDWKRIYLSASTAEMKAKYPAAAKIKPAITTGTISAGSLYFDAARFEEGALLSDYTYDTKGNYLISEKNVDGDTTNYTVDGKGNVSRIDYSQSEGYAALDYDELDRMKGMEDSSGLRKELTYDQNGNVTNVVYKNKDTGEVLSTTSQEYNELGEVTKSIDLNGNVTKFKRDELGNITTIEMPNGKTVKNGYNRLSQLISESYVGDPTTWEYVYDKNGNAIETKKNGTEITNYTVDPKIDRITAITFPSINNKRQNVQFGYNPSGKITSVTPSTFEPGKTLLHNYYLSGLPSGIIGTNGQKTHYVYDEEGNAKKLYAFDGNKGYNTYYEYDGTGKTKRIWQETEDGIKLENDDKLSYDKSGNISQILHGDNSKNTFAYDSAGRLIEEKTYNASGTLTDHTTYAFDEFGNRTSMNKNGTKTDYTYTKGNQLLTSGDREYAFDENGNQLSNGSYQYEYNAEDQLSAVKDSNQNVISTQEYNEDGLRTKKTVGNKTEYYYYIGGDLAYITNSSNEVKYSFTRNPDGDLLTFSDFTGTTVKNYFYVLNFRGDVIGLRDETGNMVVTYQYDAYGNVISSSGTKALGNGLPLSKEQPFRYASYFYDEETKLYYIKARYYDPETGRFLTEDSEPATNLYVYGANNPVSFVDEDGEKILNRLKKAYKKTVNLAKKVNKSIKKHFKKAKKQVKKVLKNPFVYAADLTPYTRKKKEQHYNRNKKNKPKKTATIAKNSGWKPVVADLHQNNSKDKSNVKYVSPDGKHEGIYNKNGKLDTTPEDMGTYNFVSPDNGFGHTVEDVIPYVLYGNSPEDSTTTWQRGEDSLAGGWGVMKDGASKIIERIK